jgi:solute:Na+ symporter, SSS family
MVFVVIGLALVFGMVFPSALVSLQLLGVSGMVQIFPAIIFSLFWKNQTKEATIAGLLVGLVVTFTVYATGSSFGIYEGFWGLLANIIVTVCINPFFVKNIKNKINPILDQLFGVQKSNMESRKVRNF